MPEDVFTQLSWFRKEQVATAHVLVVGCGALGNEVLKNLALFGIQHIVLVDFDHVEASNLSRSILFRQADAENGRYKVDVAKERLKEINPSIDIQTICGDIAYEVGLGWFRDADVVIACVDNRWARYCINRHCMRMNKPWVDGGIDGLEGTVRVFIPGINCYACNLGQEGLADLARRMPCSGIIRRNEEAGRVATTPVIASIIGAVQVQEAMKIIHGAQNKTQNDEFTSLCGKMFYYEGQHLTTKTVSFRAYDDDCPVHERWEPIDESDITTHMTVANCLRMLREQYHTEPQVVLKDCFVDFVESKRTGEQVQVMCTGSKVAEIIDSATTLRGYQLSELYQHEYSALDNGFPYQELTLAQVGIPSRDILQIHTDKQDKFIELKAEV